MIELVTNTLPRAQKRRVISSSPGSPSSSCSSRGLKLLKGGRWPRWTPEGELPSWPADFLVRASTLLVADRIFSRLLCICLKTSSFSRMQLSMRYR